MTDNTHDKNKDSINKCLCLHKSINPTRFRKNNWLINQLIEIKLGNALCIRQSELTYNSDNRIQKASAHFDKIFATEITSSLSNLRGMMENIKGILIIIKHL